MNTLRPEHLLLKCSVYFGDVIMTQTQTKTKAHFVASGEADQYGGITFNAQFNEQ